MNAPHRSRNRVTSRATLWTVLVAFAALVGVVLVPATSAAAESGGLVSDDFSAGLLDPVWSVVDGVGDGSVSLVGQGSVDARLSLSVPGGSNHDAYVTNESLRVMQPVSDDDFEMVVKFDSVPELAYQEQGILVEADSNNWLRFDVHRSSAGLRAFVGKVVGGSWATVSNTVASGGSSSVWLRVSRSGDTWSYATSGDGVGFTAAASFSQALSVSSAGVFGGNYASSEPSAPAYEALVDYVFNTASPIVGEDPAGPAVALSTSVVGSGSILRSPDAGEYPVGSVVELTAVPEPGWSFAGWSGDVVSTQNPLSVTVDAAKSVVATFDTDSTAPVISGVVVDAGVDSATVSWSTDEPASSRVAWGLTDTLEATAVGDPTPTTEHAVTLGGLAADTVHHYQVSSTDNSDNTATTTTTTFTTPAQPVGPVIDLWYGNTLDVGGTKAISQRFANVLGNVSHPSGIVSLTAALNEGPLRGIKHTPSSRRRQNPGDFNVDIELSDLQPGLNSLEMTALAGSGVTTVRSVTINYTPGTHEFAPWTIDWDTTNIVDVAQPVDGNWILDGGGVRTAQPGYDRLLAIGDVSWSDYEVAVPLTVHSYLEPGQYSGDPAIGLLLRWNGHNDTLGNGQPLDGFVPNGVDPTPLGLFPVLRSGQMQLRNHRALINYSLGMRTSYPIALGVQYIMKTKAQTQADGSTIYSMKTWAVEQAEPEYQLSYVAGTGDYEPPSGSIVLLAHEADVTFGDVTITPVS